MIRWLKLDSHSYNVSYNENVSFGIGPEGIQSKFQLPQIPVLSTSLAQCTPKALEFLITSSLEKDLDLVDKWITL